MPAVLILALLAGCGLDSSLTMPSEKGAFKGKLQQGLKMPFRERVAILPGSDSRPPVPDYVVHREQCDDLTEGGPNHGPDCVTDTIECGETIIGHTKGGVQRFDSRFYEKHFCTPYTTNHDGGDERVYQLELPEGDMTAFVYLDTPCADLDMAGIRWSEDECPRMDNLVNQCEMWPDAYARDREYMRLVSQKGSTWLIVVEGKNDDEGAFALHVQCRPGLM
jgi:hypothetical protein